MYFKGSSFQFPPVSLFTGSGGGYYPLDSSYSLLQVYSQGTNHATLRSVWDTQLKMPDWAPGPILGKASSSVMVEGSGECRDCKSCTVRGHSYFLLFPLSLSLPPCSFLLPSSHGLLHTFLSFPFVPFPSHFLSAHSLRIRAKSGDSEVFPNFGLARTRSDSSIHFGARPGYLYTLSPLHYSSPLLSQVAGTTPVHSPSTSLSHAPSYLVIFVRTCGWCTVQLSLHSSHATTVYTSLPSMENPYPVLFGFSLC